MGTHRPTNQQTDVKNIKQSWDQLAMYFIIKNWHNISHNCSLCAVNHRRWSTSSLGFIKHSVKNSKFSNNVLLTFPQRYVHNFMQETYKCMSLTQPCSSCSKYRRVCIKHPWFGRGGRSICSPCQNVVPLGRKGQLHQFYTGNENFNQCWSDTVCYDTLAFLTAKALPKGFSKLALLHYYIPFQPCARTLAWIGW